MTEVRDIGGRAVRFTRHATERTLDMALDPEEVRAAILAPEKVWPSPSYQGMTLRQAGRVTLSTREQDGVLVIVTVLWATQEAWQADYELPTIAGRDPRASMFTRKVKA